MTKLDDLARDIVGDGQLPNIFFVTVEGEVEATFLVEEDALEYANSWSTYKKLVLVEDRLTGITWESESYRSYLEE